MNTNKDHSSSPTNSQYAHGSSSRTRQSILPLRQLGQALLDKSQFGQAETVLNNVVEQARRIQDNESISWGLRGLASVFRSRGEFDKALTTAASALSTARECHNHRLLASIFHELRACFENGFMPRRAV